MSNYIPSRRSSPERQHSAPEHLDFYRKPNVEKKNGVVPWWRTVNAGANPPIYDQYDDPGNVQLREARARAVDDAHRTNRVPPGADLEPWRWVVRIFVCGLSNRSGEVGKVVSPGVRLQTSWTAATAWFVGAAHAPGANGQWLLTAAHNVLSSVYPHNKDGKAKSLAGLVTAPADSIFVVAGWGATAITGWVDKVAVMPGYFNSIDDSRTDGAALHILNSPIPAAWYAQAPSLVSLPPAGTQAVPLNRTFHYPFVVAGVPGAINRYADLAGFYISGQLHAAAAGFTIATFDPIDVIKHPAKGHVEGDSLDNSTLTWNSAIVPTEAGFSGSPGLMQLPNAAGTPGLYITRDFVAVDAHSLFDALDEANARGFNFENPQFGDGLGHLWVLNRR
ncbi:hypothetical protein EXIGLDRAFT_845218 [Exidia glandulosa HHB12029]|uniref:Uncharacterized protein n=1 Tax=Exidia glandulosa HHB12029 TaxID=1314781 RepID=A0A165BKT0_EXIGL|nr:hypothetical protein EXIGLDRAFT_845218 [Exidia glandulosa HHB12029]